MSLSVNMVKTRVMLWSTPRSVSTAFERSIRTLKNGKVFHEPFSHAFYFGPERQSTRFASKKVDPQATYHLICEKLQKEYEEADFVFAKDMALCVENKFEILLEDALRNVKHTFLIRHPFKVVRSQFRASMNRKNVNWLYFDPEEAGFRQLLELYEFVKQHIHEEPVVVDADDLLEFPNETMQSYCQAVGLKYEEGMTSWEPGCLPEWQYSFGWYEDVMKSTGFISKSQLKKVEVVSDQDLPEEVTALINKCMPHYEALKAKRIRIQTPAPSLLDVNEN